MDFSAFSGDDFDPKAWVNEALRAAPAGEGASATSDTHASGLVLKLQMFIQEVNNSLETTSTQVVEDLPRVIRSVDMIHQEVGSLKERIAVVKEDVERVERDTADSMRLLMQFDEVKGRMEATSAALQEADNWETLSADVDAAFASTDLPRISTTLLGMKRSLMVLLDVPDYAQRQARLGELQDKLEEVVGPLLASAFTSRSDEDAKAYIMALRDIDREDRVHEHYVRCHTAAVQQKWAELCRDDSKALSAILESFYQNMTDMWHQETTWGAVLFGDEVRTVVARLFGEVLQRRIPSMESLLDEDMAAGNPGAEQLERVLESFKATVNFAMSIDHQDKSLEESLFGPFFPQQKQYRRLQMLELHAAVPLFGQSGGSGLRDIEAEVGSIRDFVPNMVTQMRLAVAHCVELTAGSAASELVFALNDFVTRIATKLLEFTEVLLRTVDVVDEKDTNRTTSESAFRLLEVSGQLFTSVKEFERELADTLEKTATDVGNAAEFAALYLDTDTDWRNNVKALAKNQTLLTDGHKSLQQLNTTLHDLAYRVVLAPLRSRLDIVSAASEWGAAGADTFSLSPMPYITSIGEQLLTLPQQLEPFVANDESDPLLVALQAGPLPNALSLPPNFDGSTVDHWLDSVGKQIALLYLDEIFKIPQLSTKGCAQLSADIEYLCNVMSALDVAPPPQILQTNQLVAMSSDEFEQSANSLDLPADLIARVSKMRK